MDGVAKGRAVDELGNEVGNTALDADIVDRKDVGVIERRRGLRLVGEAALPPLVDASAQNFDRDITLQSGVARPVHFTHPARAEEVQDDEWPEAFGLIRHRCVGRTVLYADGWAEANQRASAKIRARCARRLETASSTAAAAN